MAAKRKSLLAQRVRELEDAVSRLFSGEAPAAPKPIKRRKTRRKAAKSPRAAKSRRAAAKVKKAARRVTRRRKASAR